MGKYTKITIIALSILAVGLGISIEHSNSGKTVCNTTIPDLIGLDYQDARRLMKSRGIQVSVIDTIKEQGLLNGQIVKQYPLPLTEINIDNGNEILVSIGNSKE